MTHPKALAEIRRLKQMIQRRDDALDKKRCQIDDLRREKHILRHDNAQLRKEYVTSITLARAIRDLGAKL